MMYARFLLICVLTCGINKAVLAANACYTPEQMQAEQLLRLHSELMVITVTCRQGSEGQDLPVAYGAFTKKNLAALHQAEKTMMDYYAQSTKGDATDHLDRLRTLLANEYGQKAATLSAPVFCAKYRDRVLSYNAAPPSAIANEVARMQIAEHGYAKPCASSTTYVNKAN